MGVGVYVRLIERSPVHYGGWVGGIGRVRKGHVMPKKTRKTIKTYIDGNMGYRFNVVRKIDASAVLCLLHIHKPVGQQAKKEASQKEEGDN